MQTMIMNLQAEIAALKLGKGKGKTSAQQYVDSDQIVIVLC